MVFLCAVKIVDKEEKLFNFPKRHLAVTPSGMGGLPSPSLGLPQHLQYNESRRRSSLQVPLESSLELAMLRNRLAAQTSSQSSKNSSKNRKHQLINQQFDSESFSFGSCDVGSSTELLSSPNGSHLILKHLILRHLSDCRYQDARQDFLIPDT